MVLEHDEIGIHYQHETKEQALGTKRFYEEHGAIASTPFLKGGFKYPNPKRGDHRYWVVVVRHPKKGYNFRGGIRVHQQMIRQNSIKKAAKGYHGIISKPTRFLVGEKGPERVNVTPIKKQHNISNHNVLNIGKVNLGNIKIKRFI